VAAVSTPRPSRCLDCGGTVIFAMHAIDGTTLVLDAEPNARGIFYVENGAAWYRHESADARHQPHFLACVAATRKAPA
jgi:hypothetical protein